MNTPTKAEVLPAAETKKEYRKMLVRLGLLALALVALAFITPNCRFNFCALNYVMEEIVCFIPCAAFIIFLSGPKSWLKGLGLTASALLALFGFVNCLCLEFQTSGFEDVCRILNKGGLSEAVLESYQDNANAIIGIGKSGSNIIALEEYSASGLDGYHYRLKLVQPVNSFLHKVLSVRSLPDQDVSPQLTKRADGRMQLTMEGKDKKIVSFLAAELFER